MQAYLAIKYHPDFRNRSLIEEISAALAANGIATLCTVRDLECWGEVKFTPSALMVESFKLIHASDLVIIEFTEKGTGLGIEAGYAYAKGIRIVTIAPKGAEISTTLQGISDQIFFYNQPEELAEFFTALKAVNRI